MELEQQGGAGANQILRISSDRLLIGGDQRLLIVSVDYTCGEQTFDSSALYLH